MIQNYLTVLEESLEKKTEILRAIEQKSKEQSEAFSKGEVTLPELDKSMDEKAELINQINRLDEGFDSLYQKIKQELLQDKEQYKDQIQRIQQLITLVTELSNSIQSIEARNKQVVEQYFKDEKMNLKRQKSLSKVSMNYYQNMNKVNVVPPQFMDEKK